MTSALATVLFEVFLIVSQRYHRIEAIIMGFLGISGPCYLAEIVIVKPDWGVLGLPAGLFRISTEAAFTWP